jgi:phage shock protein E
MKALLPLLALSCFGMTLHADESITNPTIDFKGFSLNVTETAEAFEEGSHRSLSEAEFLKAAEEEGVVILDARSAADFAKLHIIGAVNLPFTDFTEDSLAGLIPSKSTKVLIYCNNNFRSATPRDGTSSLIKKASALLRRTSPPRTKVSRAALNLHSAVALRSYGYTNVFHLSPLIDLEKSKIPFAGTALPEGKAQNPQSPR